MSHESIHVAESAMTHDSWVRPCGWVVAHESARVAQPCLEDSRAACRTAEHGAVLSMLAMPAGMLHGAVLSMLAMPAGMLHGVASLIRGCQGMPQASVVVAPHM